MCREICDILGLKKYFYYNDVLNCRQTSDVLFLMSIGSHGSSFHRPQWSPMSGFAFNNLTKVAIFDLWEDVSND